MTKCPPPSLSPQHAMNGSPRQRRGRRRAFSPLKTTLLTVALLCILTFFRTLRNNPYYYDDYYRDYSSRPRRSPKTSVAIMVLSNRRNLEQRQTIRETWGLNDNNKDIYFVIGRPCRELPNATNCTIEENEDNNNATLSIQQEQSQHGDLIIVNATDTYHALPIRVRDALTFLVEKSPRHYLWFAKVDDSMVVRIDALQAYLERKQATGSNPVKQPIVIGQLVDAGAPVWKTGQYADVMYNRTTYPIWPRGACGYVLSRFVALHIANHRDALFVSQGEDTSLGIWMDESPFRSNVVWTDDAYRFRNDGECHVSTALVIGHDMSVQEIRACNDTIKEATHLGGFVEEDLGDNGYFYLEDSADTMAMLDTNQDETPPVLRDEFMLNNTATADASKLPPDWIQPQMTNSSLAILVLSARGNYERRQAIRETWAFERDNVYFVVGLKCDLPQEERDFLTCRPRLSDNGSRRSAIHATVRQGPHASRGRERRSSWLFARKARGQNRQRRLLDHDEDVVLLQEQENHGDLILTSVKESYRSLPQKLIGATTWLVRNAPNLQWIAKADDDMMVRISDLERFVQKDYNASTPTVMGDIVWASQVARGGKWAEMHYPHSHYPPWPRGSSGYVFSRYIGDYMAAPGSKLFLSQGEDTSMGIWLNQSPFRRDLKWIQSVMFSHQRDCMVDEYYILGHDLEPDRIRECYNATIAAVPKIENRSTLL